MNALSVGKRLYLLVASLALLAVALTYVGLAGMSQAVGGLKTVYVDRAVPLGQLGEIDRLHGANVADILRGLQHDPVNPVAALHDHPVDTHVQHVNTNLASIDKLWAEYMASYLTPEEAKLAADFDAKYKRFRSEILQPTLTALSAGNYSMEVTSLFLKANATQAKDVVEALKSLKQLQQDEAQREFERAQAAYDRNFTLAIALAVIGIAAAMAFAMFVIRSITAPLQAMRGVIVAASQDGDFTRRIGATGGDEVAQTAQAFDGLMGTLRDTFNSLVSNIGALDQSAGALVASSKEAASSSAYASDAASSMAASIEELSVSVNQISDCARDASTVSTQSGDLSREGSQVIKATTAEIQGVADTVRTGASTIAELGQQSERISDIVNVIKDVADQTNLLALNAAIEAARAGEQGRGFAVVADEVRKLAERTTAATGEISAMIGAIQQGARASVEAMNQAVQRVESGVQMALRAENAIGDISNESDKAVRSVNEISSALGEQSAASTALAQQVERVAQSAEENSASATQASDAARHLGGLASDMRVAISRFKV